jgi:hypothetical protein
VKPIVWIVKEQMLRSSDQGIPMDYSPAMKYGELKFITEFDLPLHGRGTIQDHWYRDALRFAEVYEETDYIITTGQPMAIFMIGWMLGTYPKRPRFLVWRREENQYRVVDLDFQPIGA